MKWPRFFTKTVTLFLVFFLAACSGGGGGEGESPSTNALATASEGIRILHGVLDEAPFVLSDLSAPDVILHTGKFAITSRYSRTSRSAQTINLARREASSVPLFSLDLTQDSPRRMNIVAYGNTTSLGLQFNAFSSGPETITKGMSSLRVIHTVVGAQGISATVNDLSQITEITFGGVSDYVEVLPGPIALSVNRAVDSFEVYSGTHIVEAKKSYTFLITGEIGYYVTAAQFLD